MNNPPETTSVATHELAAVIDIGSTSIRMAVAQISSTGEVEVLDSLTQAVNLGRETFLTGRISHATIEECVRVLSAYRKKLREFRIENPAQIRVVATSAVREAANRLAFLDRVFVGSGLEVEAIDEAEVTRLTYMGVQRHLSADPAFENVLTVIAEVGGGSTEILVVFNGDVIWSGTIRLGTMRLRRGLEAMQAPSSSISQLLHAHIQRQIAQIDWQPPADASIELIALGGDIRFAAAQILEDWDREHLSQLPLNKLEKLAEKTVSKPVDHLVKKHHLSLPDAQTLGPALLGYVLLARHFSLDRLHISTVNLRDGLLEQMAAKDDWSDEFRSQVVRSAINLGAKYDFDQGHAVHVADLCAQLFNALQDEHKLGRRYESILYVAALLHEIGLFVSHAAYHKHSMYLIQNSEIFGLSQDDLRLISLVARYHRRASPQSTHEDYAVLNRELRVAVSKMAAILRIAIALDESRSQQITKIACKASRGRLVITVAGVHDLSVEQMAIEQASILFREIFGASVLLRNEGKSLV